MHTVCAHAPRALARYTAALIIAALATTASADTFTVNLAFDWTDRTGNTHGLGNALVRWAYDTNIGVSTGSGYLGSDGRGAAVGTTLRSHTTFNGLVQSVFGTGDTEWFRIINNSGDLYTFGWGPVPVTAATPGSASGTVDNTDDGGRVFGIAQFLNFGRQYAQNLGINVQQFTVRYGDGLPDSYYSRPANGNLGRITIGHDGGWCSSDVILHELGHHIAVSAGIATLTPGGTHGWEGDNISGTGRPGDENTPAGQALGVQNGSCLAFSEAFATYFAQSAVRSGNLANAIPNLSNSTNNNGISGRDTDATFGYYANAGSRAYDGSESDSIRYSIETPITRDPQADQSNSSHSLTRRGEGCELSVAMVLWDMYDAENEAFNHPSYAPFAGQPNLGGSDRVTYGDTTLWTRIISRNSPQNFREVWRNITDDVATPAGRATIAGLQTNSRYEAVSAIGQILEAAGIAFVPRGVANAADPAQNVYSFRPQFSLFEQNGGNSAYFRVLVLSMDWSQIINVGDAIAVGADQTDRLYQVTTDLAPGAYRWVVINSPAGMDLAQLNNAGIMSWYWSGSLSFTVIPTPAAATLIACAAATTARRRR